MDTQVIRAIEIQLNCLQLFSLADLTIESVDVELVGAAFSEPANEKLLPLLGEDICFLSRIDLKRMVTVIQITRIWRVVLTLGSTTRLHVLVLPSICLVDDEHIVIQLGKARVLPLAAVYNIFVILPPVENAFTQSAKVLVFFSDFDVIKINKHKSQFFVRARSK